MKRWAFLKVALFAVAVIAFGTLSFPKAAHAGCFASAEHAANPTNFPYDCGALPPPPPPPPTPPTTGTIPCYPNDANGNQSALLDVENMSGSQLYSIFLQLTAIYDGVGYAFQDQIHNSALNTEIINNMFGGNRVAYNTWVNRMGYGDGNGSNFHFATGQWTYYDINGNLVTGSIPGWSSC